MQQSHMLELQGKAYCNYNTHNSTEITMLGKGKVVSKCRVEDSKLFLVSDLSTYLH